MRMSMLVYAGIAVGTVNLKRHRLLLLALLFCSPLVNGQDTQDAPFTLRSQASVGLVPAQIQTRHGEMIYALKPEQFVLTDNGVRQKIHLDEDTDALGLSLVVAVQC